MKSVTSDWNKVAHRTLHGVLTIQTVRSSFVRIPIYAHRTTDSAASLT